MPLNIISLTLHFCSYSIFMQLFWSFSFSFIFQELIHVIIGQLQVTIAKNSILARNRVAVTTKAQDSIWYLSFRGCIISIGLNCIFEYIIIVIDLNWIFLLTFMAHWLFFMLIVLLHLCSLFDLQLFHFSVIVISLE